MHGFRFWLYLRDEVSDKVWEVIKRWHRYASTQVNFGIVDWEGKAHLLMCTLTTLQEQ